MPEKLSDLPLLLTVPRAAKILGISRSSLYRLVHAGGVQTITVNSTRYLPTRPLLRQFGVEDEADRHQ